MDLNAKTDKVKWLGLLLRIVCQDVLMCLRPEPGLEKEGIQSWPSDVLVKIQELKL